jgi:hypothetical protein
VVYIGKEADRLEDVTLGLVHDTANVSTIYGMASADRARTVLQNYPTSALVAEIRRQHPELTLTDSDLVRVIQRFKNGSKPRDIRLQLLQEAALEIGSTSAAGGA